MSQEKWRQPTANERNIVAKLLSIEFCGRDELRRQLETADVSRADASGSLYFSVSAPPAVVTGRVPTEAYYFDKHFVDFGPVVHVLLHVVEGKLHALEIYGDDGSPIERLPSEIDLDELKFY
jgi:hypothetical protein